MCLHLVKGRCAIAKGIVPMLAGALLTACATADSSQQDMTTQNENAAGNAMRPTGLIAGKRQVEDINGKGIIDRSNVTVVFDAQGRVSGSTGCNNYSGTYSVEGSKIEMGALKVTKRGCVPSLEMQQQRFVIILQKVSSWTIDSQGRLVLQAEDGRTITAL